MTITADSGRVRAAERRAQALLGSALAGATRRETRAAHRLGRLIADDDGRELLLDLTDQVLRIRDPRRAARRLRDLVAAGVPACLAPFDAFGLRTLGTVAPFAPHLAERAVDWRVNREAAGVILPGEDGPLGRYLKRRRADGFRLNVNVLGEAILGDEEADARCDLVISRIARPDIDYMSVKVSALCANLDVLAWRHSLDRVTHRLAALYRVARRNHTFLSLDMEEYRDLELSVEAFIRVLDQPEFHDLPAGIALQAYIPDSHAALERLVAWANARHTAGGAAIKIRLVKGANLAMEQVEAELHDWPQAPYYSKEDVDASYKRILDTALATAAPGAVRLGIASHNLFDVAWALTVRDDLPDPSMIEIEMLEGMAPAQARAVRDEAGSLLLYAPVVAKADRDASIAYLSRRLDENSGPENFLRSLFDLTPTSPAWKRELERFRTSVDRRSVVEITSHRSQDRRAQRDYFPADGTFGNVADTDFTTPGNRAWAEGILAAGVPPEPPLTTTVAAVDDALARARAVQERWAASTWQQRREVLARIAEVMERHRGETLSVMATTTGKTLREGDPEVSEAIDFARYAAHLTVGHQRLADRLDWRPHAVVLVAGPWNFPYAIPACGLVHALAAGGAAILKPAPEARAVGALLVAHLHEAGVEPDLIQLVATPDDDVGRHLVTHADVDEVVLTGSLTTAELFLGWRPGLRLRAETSGKNALVITAAADIDLAIKDLVRSAFGHAGQKCSAASLAVVEAEVYDDPSFRRRLADAVRSLRVGWATDPATMMGPVINPPSGPLARALTELTPGESWLVRPSSLDSSGRLWSPGVVWDVQPGSWLHLNECFGPVLGVIRARDLDHALEIQNAPQYGLTGGLHSLDPAEIDRWLAGVDVGNAYVNRHITGAIVRRQPFGGWKRSSLGGGAKPGGPAHLHAYGTWHPRSLDPERARASFAQSWTERFAVDQDPTGLRCERNLLRHRRLTGVVVRTGLVGAEYDVLALAARITGTAVVWSDPGEENDAQLARRLAGLGVERLRLLTDATPELLAAAHAAGVAVDRQPVTDVGEIELARWLKEQTISITSHRHGRLRS
ncbi:bifunctional proline dehydrogenase/L-glutamate gamma-semialdehyde dehydrogenase [Mycolicibacterium sp.]|uniref:bifunctional proline dehydrogenase/L-glutamate gamma-semialdehyde dehydrogenase n=1 Tax=Mycolicibacterium sp. TaxID=2320850 RepID=UPI0028A94AC1|nr:bifunctional proline dehydrogenase/L-glutamate gamma-semialdehyde dehydrogenase [Mycolicibacterium sp.]